MMSRMVSAVLRRPADQAFRPSRNPAATGSRPPELRAPLIPCIVRLKRG
jgi:hypothetical protein